MKQYIVYLLMAGCLGIVCFQSKSIEYLRVDGKWIGDQTDQIEYWYYNYNTKQTEKVTGSMNLLSRASNDGWTLVSESTYSVPYKGRHETWIFKR